MVTDRLRPLRVDGPHRAPGRPALPLGPPRAWSPATRPTTCSPLVLDLNVHIQEFKAPTCDVRPGRRPRGPALRALVEDYRAGGAGVGTSRARRRRCALRAGYGDEARPRIGFFTDTSVCIGCKACEVACKEWNQRPATPQGFTGESYDNTVDLGANTLAPRRVHRAAQAARADAAPDRSSTAARGALATRPGLQTYQDGDGLRWLMASDVCKHCTARRLPRRLPDRRAVPHRVRHGRRAGGHLQRLRLLRPGLPVRRARPARGRRPRLEVHALLRPAEGRQGARLRAGVPDRLDPVRRARRAARARRARGSTQLHDGGRAEARLYGADPDDGVGGFGAFFLLLDEPEVVRPAARPGRRRRATSAAIWARRRRGGGRARRRGWRPRSSEARR